MMARWGSWLVAPAAVLLALLALGAAAADAPAAKKRKRPPNIVVIVADDQTLESLRRATMPNVTRLIRRTGTEFTNSFVSMPQCCPSRATLLTGQYGHNNGVLAGNPGYPALRDPRNTLPVWLRRAGYSTFHVGRYPNGYSRRGSELTPAPGWTRWRTTRAKARYYDYEISIDGTGVRLGTEPGDYLTRILNLKAERLVRRYGKRRKPFYLQVDQRAPHVAGQGAFDPTGRCANAAIPAPRDADRFRDATAPRPPSVNEGDVSDKPSFIRRLPPLSPALLADVDRLYGCALASLREVDRGVRKVYRALRAIGEAGNTAVIYTSDHGLLYGEHRVARQKVYPYEETIRVPLLIRPPKGLLRKRGGKRRRVRRIARPVSNVDLAPTILRLAGAAPCRSRRACRTLDGRSLVGLLRGRRRSVPRDRNLLVEYSLTAGPSPKVGTCAYTGIRTRSELLVTHTSIAAPRTGQCRPGLEVEHYDLDADPFQLRNLAPAPPAGDLAGRQTELADLAARLGDCAGIRGRDPRPPSGHFCE